MIVYVLKYGQCLISPEQVQQMALAERADEVLDWNAIAVDVQANFSSMYYSLLVSMWCFFYLPNSFVVYISELYKLADAIDFGFKKNVPAVEPAAL